MPAGLGEGGRGFILPQDEPIAGGAPQFIFHVPERFQPGRDLVEEIVGHVVHLCLSLGTTGGAAKGSWRPQKSIRYVERLAVLWLVIPLAPSHLRSPRRTPQCTAPLFLWTPLSSNRWRAWRRWPV